MWEGRCEVLRDRECAFVRIHRRLEAQGRPTARETVAPKDHSKKLKPGGVNLRDSDEAPR
jgi:hypothetical protein